jgi:hypothetical protein
VAVEQTKAASYALGKNKERTENNKRLLKSKGWSLGFPGQARCTMW